MNSQISLLRRVIRETLILNEDLKNVHSKHEKTVAGSVVLRKMHDAPGVLEALSLIDSPKELAHVIEAIIDAVPVVKKEEVVKALMTVQRHERKTRR
jgi:hypothetical protein